MDAVGDVDGGGGVLVALMDVGWWMLAAVGDRVNARGNENGNERGSGSGNDAFEVGHDHPWWRIAGGILGHLVTVLLPTVVVVH